MSVRYAHTHIITKDWHRLAQFYSEVFQCQLMPPERNQSGDWLERASNLESATLQGVHLRLSSHEDHGPSLEPSSYQIVLENFPLAPNRLGLRHLAFAIDDVHTCLQQLITHGGHALGQTVSRITKGAATIRSNPEGKILELHHSS